MLPVSLARLLQHVRYAPFQMVQHELRINDTTKLVVITRRPCGQVAFVHEGIAIDCSASLGYLSSQCKALQDLQSKHGRKRTEVLVAS